MAEPFMPRWGRIKHVCELASISKATFHRIRRTDPTAPKPRKMPTGAMVEDLHAWNEWVENLPEGGAE